MPATTDTASHNTRRDGWYVGVIGVWSVFGYWCYTLPKK